MTSSGTQFRSKLPPIRGDIWRVEFDPVKGDEIRKSRPAIVIRVNAYKPLKTKLVVPLTGWQEKFATSQWMIRIPADASNGLDHDSTADALQLRCVSYERFAGRLGAVPAPVLDEIAAAIAIVIEFQ